MPAFPEARLRQAGLSTARVAQLRADYDASTPARQQTLRGIFASATDETIRRAYGDDTAPADPVDALALSTALTAAHDTDAERETFIPARLSDAQMRTSYIPITSSAARARLRPPPATIISRFAAGHGWTGGADDTTIKLYGDRSYRGVSDGAGANRVLSAASTPVLDWSGKYVRIALRVDDPMRLGYVQLWMDNGGGSAYFAQFIGNTGAETLLTAGQWAWFTIPRSLFTISGTTTGTASWTTISRPRVVFRDRATGAATLWLGAVELLPDLASIYPNGALVVEADDGFPAHRTLLRPMLDALGVPLTLNPIIERVTSGAAGMSAADLRAMQDESGWQISAHAYTQAVHDGPATPAQAAADFAATKDWLHANGLHVGADDLALCPGVGTRLTPGAMRDTVANYWRSARMFSGFGETVVPADPLSFRSIGYAGNTVAQLQANIDSAAGAGSVFHLSLHDVLAGAANGTSAGLAAIGVDNLRAVLAYALGKGMTPRTRGDWLDRR